jgi:hypothetical protein
VSSITDLYNAAAPQLALTAAMPSTAAGLFSAPRSIKEARGRPDTDEWRLFPGPLVGKSSRHKACPLFSSLGSENLDRLYSTTIHGLTPKTSRGRLCTACFQYTKYCISRSC